MKLKEKHQEYFSHGFYLNTYLYFIFSNTKIYEQNEKTEKHF